VVNGNADVKLDPNFMALIHSDSYHVFITEHGGYNGLHISQKSTNGFAVAASGAVAKASGVSVDAVTSTFSWRVVGKRSDTQLARFAKFTMPVAKVVPPVVPAPKLPKLK
jgi:hypothetical protein